MICDMVIELSKEYPMVGKGKCMHLTEWLLCVVVQNRPKISKKDNTISL